MVDQADRIQAMRSALAAGMPLIIAFWTTSEYWSGKGITHIPAERSEGAHAAVVFASEGRNGDFHVLDSRGSHFANDGCWQMSPDVAYSRLVEEVWTIEKLDYKG